MHRSSSRRHAPPRGHRKHSLPATLVAAATLLVAVASAAGEPSSPLSDRLRKALQHRGFRQARVAALVVRAGDGTVLFERRADDRLVPASNVKILTALGALSTYGPAHRFTTRVYADRQPDGRGSVGSLALLGGGDPALTSEEFWRLAADLRLAGLRRVEGDILLDDSYFDSVRWHPAWGAPTARAYHAPVGALSANYGAFSVEVRPGAPGTPPRVVVDPPVSYLKVRNVARTRAAGSRSSLVVDRRQVGTRDEVVVSGNVPAGQSAQVFQRSVSDPLAYAGAVFSLQLKAVGITIGGAVRPARVPPDYVELLAFQGKPLAEIARLFLKYSNNNIAETLVKDLGRAASERGTWEAGVAALRRRLREVGLSPDGYEIVDGSGLARTDRVSPRVFVDALRIARNSFSFGPEFVSALPIAARDGTLEHRATRSQDAIRAKTGLLDGALGLSGFAELATGDEAVFSVLVNDFPSGAPDAMAAVDGFVAALVAGS